MYTIFGTDGIRHRVNEYPMQIDVVLKIALFMGARVAELNPDGAVVIGKDTRNSCDMFESALVSGFAMNGVNVILLGVVPTAFVSLFTSNLKAQFGVMITASHNSAEYNGLKIFSEDGSKISDAVQNEIEASLYDGGFNVKSITLSHLGKLRYMNDVLEQYFKFILGIIPSRDENVFSGFKIALDSAHGAAYRVSGEIFSKLGADVTVFNNEPNGNNINMGCGAVNPDFLAQKVKDLGYDIGICLDGDADRVMILDEDGALLDGDYVMAAIVKFLIQTDSMKSDTVVATIMSNMGFEKYLNSLNLKLVRTKVGDRYVRERMVRIGSNIGGEQSGHIILSDYSQVGDGILVAVKFILYLKLNNLKVSDVRQMFTRFPQMVFNISCDDRNGDKIMQSIEELVFIMRSSSKYVSDGTRIIVRKSGTEPKIRIMIEAEEPSEAEYIASEIRTLVDFD